MPGLGRRPEFDERSREYPARSLLRRVPLVSKTWDCLSYLDQGNEGSCVGFAWTHEINADPVYPEPLLDAAYARWVYREAQKVDEWPGENYEGTSVLAGAKIVSTWGWLDEYRWAFGIDDVLDVVAQYGPVVLGMNWYEGMLQPDHGGLIYPTGPVVGGHAILCRGVYPSDETVLLHNSWGADWGLGGNAWLTFADLDRLLREDGEGCVPVARVLPGDVVDPPPEAEGCLPGSRLLSKLRRARA